MALARTARIESARRVGSEACLFDLVLVGDGPLGFRGGQYVIVDAGIDLPNGKRAKRAYSIVSPDVDQQRFSILVKRIDGGPGSNALQQKVPGDALAFSGPWGKHVVDECSRQGDMFVFATDTGVTAAIGLARSSAFAPQRKRARLVWYTRGDDDFVPASTVEDLLGPAADGLFLEPALPIGHPERIVHAVAAARCHVGNATAIFASGDGSVLHPLRQALVAAGAREELVRVESFFNNPLKKTA